MTSSLETSASWDDFLLTGIPEIDEEHKELVKRLDDLINAIRGGDGNEEVAMFINFLDQYVLFHFNSEEDYMDKIKYKGKADHVAQHQDFKRMLTELKSYIARNGVNKAVEQKLKREILAWIVNHIGDKDKQMVFYKEAS